MYGEALRKMVVEKGFNNISFSRIRDLLDFPLPEKLNEIVYVANCTTFRRLLLNKYGKDNLDIDQEIATNPDTKLTYLGYKRFLESDLQYIFPRGQGRSAHSYKRDCKYVAKQMLIRGYVSKRILIDPFCNLDCQSDSMWQAFAAAIRNAFPNHLRLSIHESICGTKLPISLLNTKTGFTTPWHCSVAQLADGVWVSGPMGEMSQDSRLELVHVDGKPSHYREKLHHDSLPISEGNASYLQSSKSIHVSQYKNGASRGAQITSSSSEISLSSSEDRIPESVLTTPEIQSNHLFSPENSGLNITLDKGIDSIVPREQSNGTLSIPYGRRLIPQIMDSLAANEPEMPVFSLTSLVKGSLKLKDVSARLFARAVNKTACWLRDQVGIPNGIQPVAYIGPRKSTGGRQIAPRH
jgi:hypothetical protein